MQIKQQELASRKSIVANPVQMDAIKRQLLEKARARAAKKAAKAEAKAAKKAAKKAKKDKKRKRAAEESSSDSDSDDDPNGCISASFGFACCCAMCSGQSGGLQPNEGKKAVGANQTLHFLHMVKFSATITLHR